MAPKRVSKKPRQQSPASDREDNDGEIHVEIHRVASATTQTVSASTHNPLRGVGENTAWRPNPPPEKPIFRGTLLEDPATFLEALSDYFQVTEVVTDARRLAIVRTFLADGAASWYVQYDGLLDDWEEFTERFEDRFNGKQIQLDLQTALYESRQKKSETAEAYLLNKRQIWKRLLPTSGVSEAAAVFTSIRGLTDTYAGRMYATDIRQFKEAIRKGRSVDATLKPPATAQATAQATAPPRVQPPARPARPAIQEPPRQPAPPAQDRLPRCWHCPGRHLNADCPTRARQEPPPQPPQLSGNGPSTSAAAPATGQ